jgi:SH3 domain protein
MEHPRMKRPLFLICILAACAMSSSAQAKTVYISDTMQITMRTGPTTENKIIAMLKTGQPVEIIEEGQDWSRVRIASEKEGWVLTRFLSFEKPKTLLLESLEKRHNELLTQFEFLSEENRTLKSDAEKYSSELSQALEALDKISTAYETLKQDSGEVIQLRQDLQTKSETLRDQNEKIGDLEEKLSGLQMKNTIHWFLAGGGVLLVGVLIGYTGKSKRRRSSLL